MLIRWLSLMSVFFLVPENARTQSYVTAMGLRMGSDFGITLQQKLIGNLTAEGIITTSPVHNQTTGTLLLEMHNPLISKRFNFYLGGGLHNRWLQDNEGQHLTHYGVTAIAGAEMTLGRVNLSWDYKPVYHLNVESLPFESQTAISMRYVFIKKIKGAGKNQGLFKQSPKNKKKKERAKAKKLKEKEKNRKAKQQNSDFKFPKNIFKKK